MNNQKVPKQRRWRSRRLRIVRFLILVLVGCLSTVTTFLVSFYVSTDAVVDAISYLLVPPTNERLQTFSSHDSVKHYQPRQFAGKKDSLNYDYYLTYKDFNFQQPATLTYSNETYANSTQILFRVPQRTNVVAVLLIFHSCQHSARDWFHTIERQRIIGAALDLGYACLVFQASDNASRCWATQADIYDNVDVQLVIKGLHGFYAENAELASLPRFTFGVSSGGIFASILATNQHYRIHGQILFTSIILPEILYNHVRENHYPPTAWIHMLRDIEFATEARVNASKQIFLERKIPCASFPIEPVQLTSTIFHDRIPSVSSDASRFMHYQIQRNHWLNYFNYLLYNPRRKLDWQGFLSPPANNRSADREIYDNIYAHRFAIVEFLNTAYGEHGISHERSFEALKWLLDTDKAASKPV